MSLTDITVISLVTIELIRLGAYIWGVTHEPQTHSTDDFKLNWLEIGDEPKHTKTSTVKTKVTHKSPKAPKKDSKKTVNTRARQTVKKTSVPKGRL